MNPKKSEKMLGRLLAMGMIGMLPLIGGCLAVAAGAAAGTGVAYHRGALTSTLNAPVGEVLAAARDTLDEMEIAVVSEETSELDGAIIGRTARDKKVNITAKLTGEDITKLSIRIGTFGDRDQSLAIYTRIRDRLE